MKSGDSQVSRRWRPARSAPLLTALVLGTVATTAAAADPAARFPERPMGADSVAGRCVVCHSLERNGPFRVAPNLFGIVGAPKAREGAWFGYSVALRKKGGVWTEEDLDMYLADASAFTPGTTKTIRVSDPEERRKIIQLLKTGRAQ